MLLYQGRCHCRATRYEINAEIDHVKECDCSICRLRGALTLRVAPAAVCFLTPLSRRAVYPWPSGTGADYFFPPCEVMPFRQPGLPTQEERDAGMASV